MAGGGSAPRQKLALRRKFALLPEPCGKRVCLRGPERPFENNFDLH
jgi:hypothetical protein